MVFNCSLLLNRLHRRCTSRRAFGRLIGRPQRAASRMSRSVRSTHHRHARSGASPRGTAFLVRASRIAAWLDGRDMVVPEDLRSVFAEVMSHRVFLDPIYELRREALIKALFAAVFETVPAPTS